MKRLQYRFTFFFSLLFLLAACTEKVVNDSSSQSNNPITTGGTTSESTGGTTSGSTTSGSTGGTTSGSTKGTTTGGTPANVFKFNVLMSGKINSVLTNWYPGYYPSDYSSSIHEGDFYQLSLQNSTVFKSDFRYKARVRALSEPPVGGVANAPVKCYKRSSGGGDSSVYPYSKLKLQVALRDVIYNNGVYSVGGRYASKNVEVNVGSVSAVLDWSKNQFPTRSPATGNDNPNSGPVQNGIIGHVVEVYNVLSDSWCQQQPASYCPFFDHPSNRCWNVELELATDLTQDF